MTDRITTITDVSEIPPEPPPRGAGLWLKENLFATPASGALSVIFGVIVIYFTSGAMNFVFDEGRRWDAITTNARLLMIQAYPEEQIVRVWLAVGIVAALLGLTLALWRTGGKVSPLRVGRTLIGIGATIAAAFFLGWLNVKILFSIDPGGGSISATQMGTAFGVGAVIIAIGWGITRLKNPKDDRISVMGLLGLAMVGVAVALPNLYVPVPGPSVEQDGIQRLTIEFTRLENSTVIPWVVIMAVGAIAYLIGKVMADNLAARAYEITRNIVIGLWVAAFPVIVLVILRDPALDYERIRAWYLPVGIAFGIVGYLLLGQLTTPHTNESSRVVSGLLLVTGILLFFVPADRTGLVLAVMLGILAVYALSTRGWVGGEMGRYVAAVVFALFVVGIFVFESTSDYSEYLVRWLVFSLALFALASPTFGGEGAARRRYLGLWVAWVIILVYLMVITSTVSTVEVSGSFFIGGLSLTIILSVVSLAASFPLGVLLALGRTSSMPIFRVLSTGYIEIVRGVPLITLLLIGFLLLPVALPPNVTLSGVLRAILVMTLFSAAYLAENVRGGLQSIPRGQNEAAMALGMSTVQMTVFITLPQALRAVIPAIVGQVIAVFKDTSLVVIVGLFDLLRIARNVIPNQSVPFNFQNATKETLIAAAIIYWIFTFSFSRYSQRLEKKLGVGER